MNNIINNIIEVTYSQFSVKKIKNKETKNRLMDTEHDGSILTSIIFF